MTVHLLRHTKPEISDGLCYGQSDIGLSETFDEELAQIKNTLSVIDFDCIFSSPLQRCTKLAKSLCPEHMELCIDNRLKELNFGDWEMKSWQDISKSEEAKKWFNDFVNVKCPKGESFADLDMRIKVFIHMLKDQTNVKEPLIITHAGVIRVFYSISKLKALKDSFDLKIRFGELKSFLL